MTMPKAAAPNPQKANSCHGDAGQSVEAAGQAPSGANMQPWHFAAVSDPAVKSRIRAAATAAANDGGQRFDDVPGMEAIGQIGRHPHDQQGFGTTFRPQNHDARFEFIAKPVNHVT